MRKGFLDTLQERVVLADGAMGTEIYRRGVFINRCYDELNVTNPRLVEGILQDYRDAGAEVMTTNTFGANRIRLQPHGLDGRVREINEKAVAIAKGVAGEQCWVAASIGPCGREIEPIGRLDPAVAREAFLEQARALAEAEPDCILLETFTSLRELEIAYRAAREAAGSIPIACSMAFRYFGEDQFAGPTPEEAARAIESWGADIAGVNCGNGPQGVLACLERMAAATKMKLMAMPNAGLPQIVESRLFYMASAEYMAEYIRRLIQKGASLVGGCCGTTPEQIREIRSFIQSIVPRQRAEVIEIAPGEEEKGLDPLPREAKSDFGRRLATKDFVVSVELDPPAGLTPGKSIEGAQFLHEHGIDAVNIADGPRAIARMSPMALALLVSREVGIETIVHYCCRDRNVLGMQMDLIGADALGLHNVLCITGDPPKMGNYPDATAVFDVDAIGLIRFVSLLNRGFDLGGRPLKDQARLLCGAGCNPGAVDLDLEVSRFAKKVEAGAEFIFSQPVYDPALLDRFFTRTKDLPRVPFLAGILPLASSKNAEFLHNEVPGMQVPDEIRRRMRSAKSREDQRREGIRIAAESLREARKHPRVSGAYIFPPFGRYQAVLDVLEQV